MMIKYKMMKNFLKLLAIFFLIAGFQACTQENKPAVDSSLIQNSATASTDAGNQSAPVIQFKETEKDFGMILSGERVFHKFEFTNIGGSNLIISGVSTSCGCTVADYSKEPVAPGKSGYVEVTFDSRNRQGVQEKIVTVLTNAEPNRSELKIKSNVVIPN